MTQDDIDTIIDSIINGQYSQAVRQIKEGCKTRPEKMAYRLATIVVHLVSMGETQSAGAITRQFDV